MTSRPPISLDGLRQWCGQGLPDSGAGRVAERIIEWMGEPLARGWLLPQVIEAAERRRRGLYELPPGERSPVRHDGAARGRCHLLVGTKALAELPLLRPAFVLPVEWRQGGQSSPLLPRGLGEFAARVLEDVGVAGLSLHLPKEYEKAGIDLSGLEISPESAWGALAAGAVVVADSGATLPGVMVTVAWSRVPGKIARGWIGDVDSISEKLDAAAEAGAGVVFVPRANAARVEEWRAAHGGSGLVVRMLSNEETSPRGALGELLKTLEIRPCRADGDSFERRCDYYTRLRQEEADAYYRDELLEEVCHRIRAAFPADPRLGEVRRIAFIASQSHSVPLLLTRLFDPDAMLVLHDGNLRASLIEALLRDLPRFGRAEGAPVRDVRVEKCDPARLSAETTRHVKAFDESFTRGRLLVDLTPGYRAFHLALLAAAPSEAVRAFVHSSQTSGQRVRPGTEELRLFDLPAARDGAAGRADC